MKKLKGQNLNPRRPVSRSRRALFSIYYELFPQVVDEFNVE